MDEIARAKAFAKRHGVPYASFDNRILRMKKGENLETIIPEGFARERLVMPLFMDGEKLAVAMADPADKALLDMIKLITSQELQPFVAGKAQLLEAIAISYVNKP